MQFRQTDTYISLQKKTFCCIWNHLKISDAKFNSKLQTWWAWSPLASSNIHVLVCHRVWGRVLLVYHWLVLFNFSFPVVFIDIGAELLSNINIFPILQNLQTIWKENANYLLNGDLNTSFSRGQQTFPIKGQIVNSWGSAGQTVSVTATEVCFWSVKAATDNTEVQRWGCIPIKLYLQP